MTSDVIANPKARPRVDTLITLNNNKIKTRLI